MPCQTLTSERKGSSNPGVSMRIYLAHKKSLSSIQYFAAKEAKEANDTYPTMCLHVGVKLTLFLWVQMPAITHRIISIAPAILTTQTGYPKTLLRTFIKIPMEYATVMDFSQITYHDLKDSTGKPAEEVVLRSYG